MKWYQKLKFARKVKGFTLDETASKACMSKSYLWAIEKGKVADPSFFKIHELLRLYNLSFEDIEDEQTGQGNSY